MRVRYTKQAQDDLGRIFAYLDERSSAGGRRVERAIKAAVELVRQFPEIGRFAGEGTIRVLPIGRTPYLLYWDILRQEIAIVHVRHSARRSP